MVIVLARLSDKDGTNLCTFYGDDAERKAVRRANELCLEVYYIEVVKRHS